jgi:hypothetical protein
MKITRYFIIAMCVAMIFGGHSAFAQYGCSPVQGGWDPKIVTSGNHVYVLWNYIFGCGSRVLFLKDSNDHGDTFGDSVIVADASEAGSEPAVAVSGNNVYVAWTEHPSEPQKILYKSSNDGGKSFGNAIAISSNNMTENRIQKVLVSGNHVGIIWTGYLVDGHGYSVFLSKSSDGGRSFGQPIILSNATGDYVPQVIQINDKAYVMSYTFGYCRSTEQTCPSHVYFMTLDIANNFSPGPMINLGQVGSRLAISDNNIYVAGVNYSNPDSSNGTNGIVFLQSIDGGISFGKPITLISYPISNNHISGLSLDASENHVYVTWYNFHTPQSGAEIFMKSSNDSGTTFGSIQVVDPIDFALNGPEPLDFKLQMSSTEGVYFATWQSGSGHHTSTGQGVLFRKSIDDGNALGNTTDLADKIAISNPGYDFVVDGNYLYLAGPDYAFKDSNHIMFSKSSDGGNSFSNQIDFDQNSMSTVPEFSFAVRILLIGMMSFIVFYRLYFRNN